MSKLTWKRDKPGRQVTTDGRYAVQSDGYNPMQSVGADAHYEGFQGGEWAAIYYANGDAHTNRSDGENMDWLDTMREAKEECQRHADRVAR